MQDEELRSPPLPVTRMATPDQVWGAALAEILGAPVNGVAITGADIAGALKRTASELASGKNALVMESLTGQAILLESLSAEAARDMRATDRLDFKAKRLAFFLSLQRAHLKVLGAIASLQNRARNTKRPIRHETTIGEVGRPEQLTLI